MDKWVTNVWVLSLVAIRADRLKSDSTVCIIPRKLDKNLKARLRIEAASHGRSMEAELRVIIGRALTRPESCCELGSRIHARFARMGGVELELQALRSADLAGSRAVTR